VIFAGWSSSEKATSPFFPMCEQLLVLVLTAYLFLDVGTILPLVLFHFFRYIVSATPVRSSQRRSQPSNPRAYELVPPIRSTVRAKHPANHRTNRYERRKIVPPRNFRRNPTSLYTEPPPLLAPAARTRGNAARERRNKAWN
jgi:hypothetical protein